MAYSLNPATDGCYEGTTCLINKLNIHDEAKLAEIEAQITFAKTAMLEESPINGDFEDLAFNEFAKRIAEFYNEINFIHPFHEGNGRAQRVYFTELIRHYGYDINFSDVDTEYLMIATIQASQGVMDFLVEFFEDSITCPNEQSFVL